ncbi:MAG: TRAP transporter substrate-binding protein, partial [Pseudolabrys sp.]
MTKFASFGCLAATAAALLMTSSVMAEQGEVDPGQVSEGLKAIFSYGRGNHTTQDHLNANTTTVI